MKVNILVLSILFLSISCLAMESSSDDPDLEKGESEETELAKLERQTAPRKSILDLLGEEHRAVFPDHFGEDDVAKAFEKYLRSHDEAKYDALVSKLETTRTRGPGQAIDPELTLALLQAFSVGLSAMAESRKNKKNTAQTERKEEHSNRIVERLGHVVVELVLTFGLPAGTSLLWAYLGQSCPSVNNQTAT